MSELIEVLGDPQAQLLGPRPESVSAPVVLAEREPSRGFTFCSADGEEAERSIRLSGAALVICRHEVAGRLAAGGATRALIAVTNPRLAFARALTALYGDAVSSGVDASACIESGAVLAPGVSVGAYAYVASGCRIAAGASIGTGARILAGARLDEGVVVQPGAVIGADGFGFERDERGRPIRFPHIGSVRIGSEVEVGANACIDRGALGDTVVEAGTKIDDLAYIAHNCRVGRSCYVMAGARICGSCDIGDAAEIAPGAVVRNKCRVGAGARVGLGAVVVDDVPEGTTVAGVPARPLSSA